MSTSNNNHMINQKTASFPWADTNNLAQGLQNGELCLATALGQFGAVVRDGLKIIETYATEQMKLNLERKLKLDKMDKLVKDLTEKCQCMQQALLYKEEKYDEKCREVERYKVICELSAKAAVNDEMYYASVDVNNNVNGEDDVSYNNNNSIHQEHHHLDRSDLESLTSRGTGKRLKLHTKISSSQATQSAAKDIKPTIPDRRAQPNPLNDTSRQVAHNSAYDMASYYMGGPTRRPRKQTFDAASDNLNDDRLREQLNTIGGINVGHTTSSDAISIDRLFHRPDNLDQRRKSCKIALVGQRNEVMSSSRDAVNRMRQKFTEKDLHRQVAEGPWNRMASRRKKEWPF